MPSPGCASTAVTLEGTELAVLAGVVRRRRGEGGAYRGSEREDQRQQNADDHGEQREDQCQQGGGGVGHQAEQVADVDVAEESWCQAAGQQAGAGGRSEERR